MPDENKIVTREDEIREIIMPVIWDTWCINEISWTEIFDYLNKHFIKDVIYDLSNITEEYVNKYELLSKN